jgi:hypothetical protein
MFSNSFIVKPLVSTQLSDYGLTLILPANSPEEEKKLIKLEPGTTALARFLGTDVPTSC